MRKEKRIRPGFIPQEDVSRFRGTRQKAMDANKLPPGHILGWIPPSSQAKPSALGSSKPGAIPGSASASNESKPLSKSAAKNAKRKAKKQAEKEKVIQENWEDSDSDEKPLQKGKITNAKVEKVAVTKDDEATNTIGENDEVEKKLAKDLEKLDVQ